MRTHIGHGSFLSIFCLFWLLGCIEATPRSAPLAVESQSAPSAAADPWIPPEKFRKHAARPGPVKTSEIDLSRHFDGFDGALVLFDESRNEQFVFNPDRCEQRFSPCSTFKAPHALIALATGALSGPDDIIAWDGVKRDRRELNRDHDLRSAIRDSVLWYFQTIAQRIGLKEERAWLARLHYGNTEAGDDVTRFWIDGTLRISAFEQIGFMGALATESLDADRRTQQLVKELLVVERGDNWTLFGKTGTGGDGQRATLGWFVGWLRYEHKNYYFAANMAAADRATGPRCRTIVRAILAERYDPTIAAHDAAK